MKQVLLEMLTWKDVEEIILAEEEVLKVGPYSYPDPETYYKEVLNKVRGESEFKPPIGERYDVVLSAAQEAVGKKLCSGRATEDVLIRVFVAYRLRQEGYSFDTIGKVMHRDHSTVMHYVRKKMDDMLSLPDYYRNELDMYDKMCALL